LAAILGHELNNITVPLDGFTELAVRGMAADEGAGLGFNELQIAIERIKSLASELEILGETESHLNPVAIGDCMPPNAGGDAHGAVAIEWRCSAAVMVRADRLQTRGAVQALMRLAQPTESPFDGASLIVSQRVPPALRCVACGRVVAQGGRSVLVEIHSARAILAGALRQPFGRSRLMRSGQRLTLAALVHSAHCAGGHILLDEPSTRLSLVMAAA
jgi:hypothetical protein